jgi:ATP-binding cassette, subfamily B, bacterial
VSRKGYKRLLPYIFAQWRKFGLILVVTAAASGIVAVEPLPLKLLVDYAAGSQPAPPWLIRLLEGVFLQPDPIVLVFVAAGASLGLFLLVSAVDALLSWAWVSAGQRMVYDLSAALFYKLQRLSLASHVKRPIGDSLGRLVHDSWSIYSLSAGVMSPIQALMTLVTVGAVSYRLDPGLAAVSLALAPALGAVSFFFGPKIKKRAHFGREAESRLMSFVHQTLEAIPLVQAFGTEARNRQHFHSMADDAVTISRKSVLVGGTYRLMTGFLLTAGLGVILLVGSRKVLAGTMPLGSLLVFLAYMKTLQTTTESLLKEYGALKPVQASVERVLDVLDSRDIIQEKPAAQNLTERSRGEISFEDVRFGYETGHPILRGVTLTVHPGETVAVVGASGAGKTTLVSLIPRFFDPWEGRVTLDGTDVRDIKITSLREQVALVLQDPFLLQLSVAENIAFGRPHATRDEIEAAAEAANADGFIRRLPDGYDTVIGQRGSTLSGGERQRISIARALLKDTPILILDEPTSALDASSETAVMKAIERLMANRTTIIVAHRLSTARKADRIVVLDLGTIVEVGSHRELMAARGFYHSLYSLQFRNHRSQVPA